MDKMGGLLHKWGGWTKQQGHPSKYNAIQYNKHTNYSLTRENWRLHVFVAASITKNHMTLFLTLLLEKVSVILLTRPSSVNYLGHVGQTENVGHASEDRTSTPAESRSAAIMVSGKLKKIRTLTGCVKSEPSSQQPLYLNTFSKWCDNITTAREKSERRGRRKKKKQLKWMCHFPKRSK